MRRWALSAWSIDDVLADREYTFDVNPPEQDMIVEKVLVHDVDDFDVLESPVPGDVIRCGEIVQIVVRPKVNRLRNDQRLPFDVLVIVIERGVIK